MSPAEFPEAGDHRHAPTNGHHEVSAPADRSDPALEPTGELLPQSAENFISWLQETGLSSRLAVSEGDSSVDEAAQSAIESRYGHRPSLAHALVESFQADVQAGRVTTLPVDDTIVGIKELGRGGMGTVYASVLDDADAMQAHTAEFVRSLAGSRSLPDTTLDALQSQVNENIAAIAGTTRLVATKLIQGKPTVDRSMREFWKQLRHQAAIPVPRVLGGSIQAEQAVFHMEHLAGYTLSSLLKVHGLREAVPPRLAADVAALTSLGAYHIANAHLLHRDYKPENVFVLDDGSIRILDLGLAKSVTDESMQLTADGSMLGTANYMAPEVARGQQNVTPKADVFSLGVMYAELFSGRLPYLSKNAKVVETLLLRQHMSADDEAESIHVPTRSDDVREQRFAKAIEQFVGRMIHPDPEQRPDMDEVAHFFHENSRYGNLSFAEYANPHSFPLLRLPLPEAEEVTAGQSERDYPVDSAYRTPAAMWTSLQNSSVESADYDFLDQPQYGHAKEVLSERLSTRSKLALLVGGTALLTLPVVMYYSGERPQPKPTGKPKPGLVEPADTPVVPPAVAEKAPVPEEIVVQSPVSVDYVRSGENSAITSLESLRFAADDMEVKLVGNDLLFVRNDSGALTAFYCALTADQLTKIRTILQPDTTDLQPVQTHNPHELGAGFVTQDGHMLLQIPYVGETCLAPDGQVVWSGFMNRDRDQHISHLREFIAQYYPKAFANGFDAVADLPVALENDRLVNGSGDLDARRVSQIRWQHLLKTVAQK